MTGLFKLYSRNLAVTLFISTTQKEVKSPHTCGDQGWGRVGWLKQNRHALINKTRTFTNICVKKTHTSPYFCISYTCNNFNV